MFVFSISLLFGIYCGKWRVHLTIGLMKFYDLNSLFGCVFGGYRMVGRLIAYIAD